MIFYTYFQTIFIGNICFKSLQHPIIYAIRTPLVKWRSPPSSGRGPSLTPTGDKELSRMGDEGDIRLVVSWDDRVVVVVVFLLLLSHKCRLGSITPAEEGLSVATISILPLPLRPTTFHWSSASRASTCGLF